MAPVAPLGPVGPVGPVGPDKAAVVGAVGVGVAPLAIDERPAEKTAKIKAISPIFSMLPFWRIDNTNSPCGYFYIPHMGCSLPPP